MSVLSFLTSRRLHCSLPIQLKYPCGWKITINRRAYSLNFCAASAGNLAIAALATRGDIWSFALSAPTRNSRTTEWAPSAPISRSPVSVLPSLKTAVAFLPSDDTSLSFFPYCSTNQHSLSNGAGGMHTCISTPFDRRRRNFLRANRTLNGTGSALISSSVSPLKIGIVSSAPALCSST